MRYFPLFADLRDRRVLVVGGGEVAERKVRLLRDAGARVRVVARTLTPWLAGQAADSAGVITHLAADYADEQLDGVVLAIAATDDRELNARVASAARARNLLANVVDDAELSGFIVPAIVDRSPVMIAVSSGGTAPVLARLIRERLETAVDESIGPLAELLARSRARIRAAFPDLAARRRFYTKVVRGRVAELLRARRSVAAERELERSMTPETGPTAGSVVLVGAGPGDPGLLTLNALRALQDADVILHDRLVADEVLALARRDATRISVGKAAGAHSVSQAKIHELMIEHARAGRRVVRLKGGDPFIFGRGGEELEALRAAGVAVRGRAGDYRGSRLRGLCGHSAHAPPARTVAPARDGALWRFGRSSRLAVTGARAPDACFLHGRGPTRGHRRRAHRAGARRIDADRDRGEWIACRSARHDRYPGGPGRYCRSRRDPITSAADRRRGRGTGGRAGMVRRAAATLVAPGPAGGVGRK